MSAICCFIFLTAGNAAAQSPGLTEHTSGPLIELAADFRAFRSPLFRPRTWRPTHRVEGIPDYARVKREQIDGLREFRARLNAIDPARLSVHEQVDYLLLRSEMDDVYFEQHILREIDTNPSYYVEQAVDRVAAELRTAVPYSESKARAIIAAFDETGPILKQARDNLILNEAAPELAEMALRHLENIRAKYEAGVALFEPHFPRQQRATLRSSAARAAHELENYRNWVQENIGQMQGTANVGAKNMQWYFERVNFVPWSLEDLLAIGEHEKNRFLMSIEIEETKNQGLPELTMPTTDEWIEWFRLTYLQTKYWLKERELISFHDYIGESFIVEGTWQEPFGGIGNRPGLLGFTTEPKPENAKRLFVVPEEHWFTNTYWERTMRLDPITDYQHSDWPGHYFEAEVTSRNPCPIRAIHRDTGFSQGWAHYWEEFFMDMGYPFLRGPRTRELTYNFLLLRAVRVPMDIMLSEGELSVDEAVQYQIDRVPTMEEHISRAEVDMYVRWPYQATSYIIGKKQIEQMLGETIMKNDFTINWREFHDALLEYGQIAPALVRYELLGKDDQVRQFWDDVDTP
ncbi:MAG: DUF885 domain-containing protein [Gammaproteobacteria bacterium]|nr:DUF885 domain-containing protein [Gammaproteobacteria bacterium]MDH5309522.1 DUF885 domain-containing protein [Gammaproteobacteria bacterium]